MTISRFLANRAARVVFCALSLAATSETLAATGRTPGAFEVSSSGEATYTIPLWMPPGPNGLQPDLALTYNSRTQNGLLGVGWSLDGVSAIERCYRTRGQDASTGGVSLTADDKFCLDGERLRLTSGTYGAANSTYQTEKETFAVVTAYSSAGTGPSYFIVEGNDALTYEFGRTTDSRVLAGTSPTPLRWMLNKVTDRAGNTYVFTYSGATNGNGSAVPASISWTPVAAGSTTYRYSATFTYSTKTEKDSISGFVAQQPVTSNQRLDSIEIASSGAVVRKYALTYDTGSVSQRSRLTQIKECSDAAASNCLAPTVVTYQAGALVASTPHVALSSTVSGAAGSRDFNGDGRDDLLFTTGTTRHVAFSTGSGFGTPQNTGIDQATAARGRRFATNGQDGLLANSGGSWWYYWWNGAAFTSTSLPALMPATVSTYQTPDMNGDGLADLLWLEGTQLFVRLNTTAAGAATPSFSSTAQLAATINAVGFLSIVGSADIDGDGNEDFMTIRERQPPATEEPVYYVRPYYARGAVYEAGAEIYLGLMANVLVRLINFNDDRCADWTTETAIHISRCGNTDASTVPQPPDILSFLDWDSDGRDDLLFNNGGFLGVYRSTGSSNPATALAPSLATSIPYTDASYSTMDADGDGLKDFFVTANPAPRAVTYYKRPEIVEGDAVITTIPDLATQFADGYGVTVAPQYTTTARSSHTPGQNTQWPLQNIVSEVVVRRVTSSDGIGGTYTTDYSYVGGRFDGSRGEFVGFEQRTMIDSRNNLRVRTTYEQGFPKTGLLKKQELLHANGTPIGETTNEYLAFTYTPPSPLNGRSLPYLWRSTSKTYDLSNAQLIATTTTTNTVDENNGGLIGSLTQVVEAATANGAQPYTYSSNTYNTLFNASGCLGRPATTTVTNSNTVPGQSSIVRTTQTTWSSTYCRPTQVTVEPGNSLWQVTTDLLYDAFGNVNHITQTPASGQGQTAHVTQVNWGATGQFPTVITNAKNQNTTLGWDPSLGTRTSVLLPNGTTTSWTYDPFGRVQSETRADNTRVTYTPTTCASGNSYCSGLADFRYKVDVRAFDSNDYSTARRLDTLYFDAFGRIRYSDAELLTGTSRTITSYDALGRVASSSVPHTPGGTTGASIYEYDLLGRETFSHRQASETDTTTINTQKTYSGLRVVAYDPMGKTQTFVHDALGRVVQSIDALNSRTEYEYDAFGNLLKTIAAAQDATLRNEIVATYNVRGQQLTLNDPDLGACEYSYYPFGELKRQRDAKLQDTFFYYDELSRLTSRVETEGTTSFVYDDPLVNGEGQLTSMSTTASGGYAETYSYDSFGRRSNQHITIGAESFDYDYTYAVNGALSRLTYPTTTGTRLAVDYAYQKGILTGVTKVGSTTYWGSPTLNSRGQVTSATLGNGVVMQTIIDAITGLPNHIRAGLGGGYGLQNESYLFDYVGNLQQRQNGNPSLTENFVYDDLHRLDYSTLGGVTNLDMSYNVLGNITARSDIQSGATWTYHATKRHAVTQAGPNTYSYDANGNAITRNGHEIKWTSYNYPYEINGPGKKLTFSYGPDRQRYRQEYQNGSTTETTLYIGGLLEKVTIGGVTDWRHHIVGDDQVIAIVSRKGADPEATWYLLNDHLGSVAKILNSSGGTYVSESFAAFGARRDASAWSGPCPCPDLAQIKAVTRLGFTGHEMIGGQSMGLIHMNGRVQDSVTGRFLSPDPFVQAPFNAQSLNRYSYVFNNPLNATDPSGFVRFCRGANEDGFSSGEQVCFDFPDRGPIDVPDGPGDYFGGGGGRYTGTILGPKRSIFKDNFAGRTLRTALVEGTAPTRAFLRQFGIVAGAIVSHYTGEPTRDLISGDMPSGRELMDAQMGVLTMWVPTGRATALAGSIKADISTVGAMQVRGMKVAKARVIALGLTSKKFDEFAIKHGAKTWEKWQKGILTKIGVGIGRIDYGAIFNTEVKKADVILFYLHKMDYTSVGNLPITFEVSYRLTEAELGTVLRDPKILKKTTFYDDVTDLNTEDVLERFNRPGLPDPDRYK